MNYGWLSGNLEGEISESERIIDELGFSGITEPLANELLPNINTRYHSLKYYLIVCLGIKIVNDYIREKSGVEEEESAKRSEVSKSKYRKLFRVYIDYYEYWIACLHDRSKHFIGEEICVNMPPSKKPFGPRLLERNTGLIRKKGIFLTSGQSYAYDRYKTSLEFCNLILNNRLTIKGEDFVKYILESSRDSKFRWRDIYNTLKTLLDSKPEIRRQYSFTISKPMRKKIKRILIDLEYRPKDTKYNYIQEIYEQLKKRQYSPFEKGKFPKIRTHNKGANKILRAMEFFYNISNPINEIVNKLIEGKEDGNRIDNMGIEELLKPGAKWLKKLHYDRNSADIISCYDKNGAMEFIEDIYSFRADPYKVLNRMRERIGDVKNIELPFSFVRAGKEFSLNEEFEEKMRRSRKIDVNRFRLDILYDIMREIEAGI